MYDSIKGSSLCNVTKASWNTFSQACAQRFAILLIFFIQQLVLYYMVYYLRNNKRIVYALILDVVIGIYLLFGCISTQSLSSASTSVQWCLCCSSTIIKLIPLLYSKSKMDFTLESGFDRFAAEDYLSFIGLYPMPMIYTLFNLISNRSLFDRENENIIVDELLHSDIALYTTIDLWDIVIMINHLIRRYRVHYESDEQTKLILETKYCYIVFGVFSLTSAFLLGQVSPTVDGDLRQETGELEHRQLFWDNFKGLFKSFKRTRLESEFNEDPWSHEMNYDRHKNTSGGQVFKANPAPKVKYLDLFTIAKFKFLVGFFLIDIPFFVYRVVLLIRGNVFSLLIYKNLLGMLIRPYRLNQSQLAERDSAKGWQSAFFETAPTPKDPTKKNLIHEDLKLLEESSDSDIDKHMLKRGAERPNTKRGKSVNFSSVRSHTRNIISMFSSFLSRSDTATRSQKTVVTYDTGTKGYDGENVEYYTACDEVLAPRLRFLSSNKIINDNPEQKLSARYNDERGVQEEDEDHSAPRKDVLVRMINRHRDLPIQTFQIKLMFRKWIMLLKNAFAPEPTFEMGNEEFLVDEQPYEFMRIAGSVALSLLSRIMLVIYCYSYSSGVRSPRFIFIRDIQTVSKHEIIVYGVTVAAPLFQSALFFQLQGCTFLGCVVMAMKEIVSLCSYVMCVCCLRSIVDKPYSIIYAMQLLAFLLWPLSVFKDIVTLWIYDKLNLMRLILMVCKYELCPVSLNHKLFCLDIIKSSVIGDLLLHSQWNYYTYSALFRILCCSFSPSKTGVVIIMVDLLVRLIYIAFCQTMRALMFRKFEIHYLTLRLTNNIKFDYQSPYDTLTMPGDATKHFTTHAEVDEYIRENGLLSSPGVIFPAFI